MKNYEEKNQMNCYIHVFLFSTMAIMQSHADGFDGNFESGIAGWRPYETKEPASLLSACQEGPFSGKNALKVATPGMSRLEGATVSIPATPDHNHTVKVRLKGSGTVLLGVSLKRGWIYRKAFDMNGAWQEYAIRFLADTPAPTFAVITSGDKPQKTVFHIDNVEIVREDNESLPDAEVPPFRIEAEDFRSPTTPGKIVADTSAGGGAYVEERRYYWLTYEVPYVPQTAKPFFIWLRVRGNEKAENAFSIARTLPDQQPEVFFTTAIPASVTWHWIRTGPYSARMGKTFSVTTSSPDANAVIALDSMVITTDGVAEQDLDQLRK